MSVSNYSEICWVWQPSSRTRDHGLISFWNKHEEILSSFQKEYLVIGLARKPISRKRIRIQRLMLSMKTRRCSNGCRTKCCTTNVGFPCCRILGPVSQFSASCIPRFGSRVACGFGLYRATVSLDALRTPLSLSVPKVEQGLFWTGPDRPPFSLHRTFIGISS